MRGLAASLAVACALIPGCNLGPFTDDAVKTGVKASDDVGRSSDEGNTYVDDAVDAAGELGREVGPKVAEDAVTPDLCEINPDAPDC